ncbi:peroxidase-like [Anticarsia gemmatalis]|uniref:peroxidase-like n=1 Tax=Anticarsia gemmatalis TaxID=129554 RepID=UPI003F75C540
MYFSIVLLFEIFVSVLAQDSAVLYDAYFGKPVTEKRGNYLTGVANGTTLCTVLVRQCRKDEGRRVDGTCTNPHYPSRGATMTPLPRLLPPQYGPGNTLRPASDGSELPSARLLRTTLFGDGFFRDHYFSTLATHFHVFTAVDNVDLVYLLRYPIVSDCCLGNTPNRINPICIPIPVPGDDPYLRASGVRCLNLTRVENFQDYGCLPPTLPADRYSRTTPLLDLSPIYGNTELRNRLIRANQGGLLAFRMEGDREVPAGQSIICLPTRPPEPICYNFADELGSNLLPGTYLTSMWFFREHNRIARRLAMLNPCWDDEKLFQTARQINIAQYQYIFYYELIPDIIGRKNAIAEGVIYETYGFVNDFDPRHEPGVYREYTVGTRWFHTYQEGALDLYRDGVYRGSRPVPDDIGRGGSLATNNTEADLTQGSYIQPSARFDYIFDPQFTQRYAGGFLRAADLPATDFMRGRDAGFQSYNEYRKVCGLKAAKYWDDFYDTIDKDKVESLRRLYDDINDVELMVAIYLEKWLPGAFVGPTLYCIMVHNLILWRKSDKFFFEHGNFPAALTKPQLNEIRKASMSRILCDSGDSVKQIQPHGFFRITAWNKPVLCENIPGINLNKWKDHWCPKPERGTFYPNNMIPNNLNPNNVIPSNDVPNPGIPNNGVPNPGVPNNSVPNPGLPINGVPNPGIPNNGVPMPGIPNNGIPNPEIPNNDVPKPGTPNSGVPNPGIPNNGVPNPGIPNNGVRNPGIFFFFFFFFFSSGKCITACPAPGR